ncbi:MAG: nicotinamide-nucleotide adenylyltransferase [Methanosarcinales archaeon]|jgi:nicotinamide-nucleotide adenylyltransferase|nr:nicotinamide-nucleotide adenylyltransferase [Methanosarcinales archaeon]
MKRAFYVGRFQPYHLGHHAVLNMIAKEVDELVIGVGSAQKSHEVENPFTAGERIVMIQYALQDMDIQHYTIPIEDIQQNTIWVSHVLSKTPPFDIVYSNNPLVIQLFEEASIKVMRPPIYKRNIYSGTLIRDKMLKGENWQEFVPDSVANFIEEFNGIDRLINISKTD